MLLGHMSQDGFVGIRTVLGHIGIGEPIKQVAVAHLDGLKPCLLDWESRTCMVESNQGANAW